MSRWKSIAVFCAVWFAAVVAVPLGAWKIRRVAVGRAPAQLSERGGQAPSAPAPKAPEAPADEASRTVSRAIRVTHTKRVDLLELHAHASRAAHELEPRAELVGVRAERMALGAVDLSRPQPVVFSFEVPPSAASDERAAASIEVTISGGQLTASKREVPRTNLDAHGNAAFALACSSARAWEVAVKNGAAKNAHASFTLRREREPSALARFVWTIHVPGAPGSTFGVDGSSCALLGAPVDRPPVPFCGRRRCGPGAVPFGRARPGVWGSRGPLRG
jgi:hypothetical protein